VIARRVVAGLLALTACAGARPAAAPAPLGAAGRPAPGATLTAAESIGVRRAALRMAIDSLIDDRRFRSAEWGILIVDPAHDDTLYAHNAGKLFLPASNMKIITATTALAQLGPDYRYRTTYAARGPIAHGVLHGDLVVIGRGDPTVSDHMAGNATLPLRAVADSLAARGIRRITGHLVRAGDAFPGPIHGFGWDWDDLAEPYAAGVDELMFNEGITTITVHGGARPGAAARVSTGPSADYPAVHAHVATTQPTGDGPSPALTATYDSATHAIDVAGTISPGDSVMLQLADPDPSASYLAALGEALVADGIRVRRDGVSPGPLADSTARLDTLVVVRSPPLREILPAMLKPSQNQIAEALLRTIGLERTGVGTADSGARVVRTQLLGWGADTDGFVIRDGSGLSRHDYLSPATIVRALTATQRDTAFEVFYDAMPIAGVDGTIERRMVGTTAAGNVRAKTGYVDRARSLSGYVTTADGVALVFSFLCNNWTTSVHDVERVQDAIAVRLADLALRAH
jgi:D-alanyl-D-alanine carboxypeptidase/D-alanyl-D-alanine-endopeptidase (penicillin-binding protein 4)